MAKSRPAAESKAAKAEATAARKAAAKERRSRLWQAFNMQRKQDKRLLPYMVGAFVLIVAAAVAIGIWAHALILTIPFGLALGALLAFIIFGRRAQRSIYRQAEGQAGAAGWVGQSARQVAGDSRYRPDRSFRSGAPGDRPPGRHLRR